MDKDMTKVTTSTKGDYTDAHESKRLTLSDGNGHSSEWKPVDRFMDRVKRYASAVVAVFAMCAAVGGSVVWAHNTATKALVDRMIVMEAKLDGMAKKQDVEAVAAKLDIADRQKWVISMATRLEIERALNNREYIPIPDKRIEEIHKQVFQP